MIHLKQAITGQTIWITGKERSKYIVGWEAQGICFILTDELTEREVFFSVPYGSRIPLPSVIITDRYFKIPGIDTNFTQPATNGGVDAEDAGYFSYVCWEADDITNKKPNFDDLDEFLFIERGLCLIGPHQEYFEDFDEDIPASVAYTGT